MSKIAEFDSGKTKYNQVADHLLREIRHGGLKPGDQIAPEFEITRTCGVSRHTVRKAISDLVKEGILCRRQGLGTFVDNPELAQTRTRVAENKSRNMALCLYDVNYVTNPYFSTIAKGIVGTLEQQGYRLQLTSTKVGVSDDVGGAIVLDQTVPDHELVNMAEKVPLVVIDREIDHPNISSVCADNYSGVFNSTEYLISLGHRRIVFFSEVLRWPKTQEMVRGFHNALKKHELSFEDCPVEEETHAANSMDAENFHYVTLRLVRLIRDLSPTALLLSNDWLAFIFLKVLQDIGQDVPSDMAVMGYNDDPVSQLISPSLSTVSVHLEGMGREAGAALVSLLNSGERVTRIVQPQLVIRKSTAPPSRDRR